jgi:hypothetical protein
MTAVRLNTPIMRRSGKAHWITIAGILGLLAIVLVFFIGGETPSGVTNRFMIALAEGDVNTLCDLSHYEGSKDSLRAQWEYATKVAGPHYRFAWIINSEKVASNEIASVKTTVERAIGPDSFPEKVDIPLVKREGKWKVDVRGIWRGLYPALPR